MENNRENREDGRIGAFPANINKVNPNPGPDALSITALVKGSGKVVGYQLSDGRKVSREEGVQMAKDNQIKGVAVAEKKGAEFLRGMPDGDDGNNLGNLPSVTP